MTVGEWVAAQTPTPPSALRERITHWLGESASEDASRTRAVCMIAAMRIIRMLTAGEAKRRDSAIDLLAADSLVTYAIDASADSPKLLEELNEMVLELVAIHRLPAT